MISSILANSRQICGGNPLDDVVVSGRIRNSASAQTDTAQILGKEDSLAKRSAKALASMATGAVLVPFSMLDKAVSKSFDAGMKAVETGKTGSTVDLLKKLAVTAASVSGVIAAAPFGAPAVIAAALLIPGAAGSTISGTEKAVEGIRTAWDDAKFMAGRAGDWAQEKGGRAPGIIAKYLTGAAFLSFAAPTYALAGAVEGACEGGARALGYEGTQMTRDVVKKLAVVGAAGYGTLKAAAMTGGHSLAAPILGLTAGAGAIGSGLQGISGGIEGFSEGVKASKEVGSRIVDYLSAKLQKPRREPPLPVPLPLGW